MPVVLAWPRLYAVRRVAVLSIRRVAAGRTLAVVASEVEMTRRACVVAAVYAAFFFGCSPDDPGLVKEVVDAGGGTGSTTGTNEEDSGATTGGVDVGPPQTVTSPEVYSLSVKTGPTSGGTVVAISGAGFRPAARVHFGDGEASVVKYVDAGRLAAVTPGGVPGAVDVVVTNADGGGGTFASGFIYYDMTGNEKLAPTILQAIPSSGPAGGGTAMLLKGNDFQPGAVLLMDWKVVSNASVTDAHFVSLITPSTSVGAVDIAITNPDGQSHIKYAGFNTWGSDTEVPPKPQITDVYPKAGSVGGGLEVEVSGSSFVDGSMLILGGQLVESWTVESASVGRFVTPPHTAGLVTLAITDLHGQSAIRKDAFLYFTDPPVLFSLDPDVGPTEGGNTVTLHGDHFKQGATVDIGGKPCVGVTVLSADGAGTTSDTATCVVPPGDAPGSVLVQVTNPDGLFGVRPNGYTYISPNPIVAGVVPDSGPLEGGFVAIIVGEDFQPDSEVWFGGTKSPDVLVYSPTSLGVVIPASQSAGPVTVTVKKPGFPDASLEAAFTYLDLGPPAISAVEPTEGPAEGGVLVAVSGENLRPESQVWFDDTPSAVVSYGGPNGITVKLPAGQVGPADVKLITPGHDPSVLEGGFTYTELGPPILTSVSPQEGPVDGGLMVAIVGENLRPTTTIRFGGTAATDHFYGGPDGMTVVLPAGSGPGAVDVALVTPGYEDSTLAGAFTYTALGPPALLAVTPQAGPAAGGVLVAVTGENLRPDSVVNFGGAAAATVSYGGPNGITVTLPGHAPGVVDVVLTTPGFADSALLGAFTYEGEGVAMLESVEPAQGPVEGGIVVAVVGANLPSDAEVWFGAAKAAIHHFSGSDGISVTLPPGLAGAVDVRVTFGGEELVLPGAFTYVEPGPPSATGVVPASGPTAGGIVVLVQGNDLRDDSEVWFDNAKADALSHSPSAISVVLPAGQVGTANVTVKTTGYADATVPAPFTYVAPPVSPDELMGLSAVQPSTGPTSGGGWALLKGFNLPEDAVVRFGNVEASEVVAVDESLLSVRVPAGAPGLVSVEVESPLTGLTATLPGAYLYYAPEDAVSPPPTLTWIKPALGPASGGTLAWLSGAGLQPGALVFMSGVPGSKVTVPSGVTGTFVTPAGSPGPVDVTWVNPDGQFAELANAFVYTPGGSPSVKLTSALPQQGSVAGGTVVTLAGSGFVPGLLAFVDGVPALTSLKGPGALELTTPAHDSGLVDIAVTAPDGWTAELPGAFNYILQAPFVAAITPNWGSPAGGTQVLVSGQGFHPAATLTIGGAEATILEVDDGLIIAITPVGELGPADVAVANPDFLSSTLEEGFLYTDETPGLEVLVSGVQPNTAPTTGGTLVTITGAGFEEGATVIIGAAVSPSVTVLDEHTLLAEVPAGSIGAKDLSVVVPEVGTGMLPNGFFYHDPLADVFPTLFGLYPTVGPTGGGTIARIDVTPAPADAQVFVGGAMAKVLGADGEMHLVVEMPAHPAGVADVSIMLPSGAATTAADAFTYYEPGPTVLPPVLTKVDPTSGSTLGGEEITLTGLAFGQGPIAFLGYRPIKELQTSEFAISGKTPVHDAGLVDTAITRADGFSVVLKSSYGFSAPAPKPEVVFPTVGHIDGGLTVVLSGVGFAPGAKVFLGDAEASSVLVPAHHVLSFVTPPVGLAGVVDIAVHNPDGQIGVLEGAFTYSADDFDKPAPTVLVVQPGQGPWQGGTVAAVYGTGFQTGAQILFGGKPAEVHLIDDGLMTVTTPSGFVGPVDVVVLNPDGQSGNMPAGFKYIVTIKPKPAVLGITPKSGPESGGTAVIVTGSQMTGGGVGFVGYRPLSSWTVLNTSIATGTTVANTPGAADVVVTNGDGQSATLEDGFNYVGSPKIDSFDPSIGAVAGGKVVHIAGANFSLDAQVEIGGKPAASVVVLSAFVIKIQTPPGDPGPAQVKVTNPDGQSHVADQPYVYVLPPLLTSIFPAKGSALGGTPVILTGASFFEGITVSFGEAQATGVVVVNEATLILEAPPGVIGAIVDVTASNIDGQSAILYKAYTYVDLADIGPPPALDSLSPATGPTTGGTWGLAHTQDLQTGAWALFGAVPVSDLETLSATLARFVSAESALTGTVTVTLLNPDGGFSKTEGAWTYTDPDSLGGAPEITALDPVLGPTKGGTPITFSGANLDAETVVFFGTAPAVAVAAADPAILVTTPAHSAATVDVVVTGSDGQTVILDQAFEFVPPPALTAIEPTKGPSSGGTFVTLSGENFIAGDTAAKSSRVLLCEEFITNLGCVEALPADTVVKDTTTITFTTPEQLPGLADVVVVNPDGQTGVLEQAYLFTPPPKVLGVNPQSGSTKGGDVVEIAGTGFQPGLQVTFSGQKALDVQVQGATKILCQTPPGAAGPAAVTVTNPDLSNHTLGGGFLYVKPPTIVNAFPTLGPESGGTVVTIQGDGFVETSQVYFGSELVDPQEFNFESENVLKVKTPAGSGVVAIKIVNPDEQKDVLGGGFIYIPVIPEPKVTALQPNFGPTGGGYLVQVTGEHFLQGAELAFGNDAVGWHKASNVKVKNAGTLVVGTAPAHPSGTVDVRVMNSDGQFGILAQGFQYLEPLGLPGLAFAGVVPDRGPPEGGYEVVIYGQGFKSGIRVFFGEEDGQEWVEATQVVRLGPTVLRVTVPNYGKTGKADIRLSNPAFGGLKDEVVGALAFTFGQAVILDPYGHRLPIDIWHDDLEAVVFDANGDDLNDIFIAHNHYKMELLINTLDADGIPGKFVDQTETNMPDVGNYHYARFPRAWDVDKDGDQDVVVLYSSSNRHVGLYRNAGDGTFTFEGKGDHGLSNPSNWEVGDLDCDGIEDILIVGDGINRTLVGSGTGDWIRRDDILPNHSEKTRGAAIGDIDNDGDNDIVVVNDQAAQNRLYFNNCNNTPLPPACSFDVPNCEMLVYDGHRYAVCQNEAPNYWNSRNKCQLYGMELATINNAEEQAFLRSKIAHGTWLGLREFEEEHNFLWEFGSSEYQLWCANQPNDGNVDDCGYMTNWDDTGCYDDMHCNNGARYICEGVTDGSCPEQWKFTDGTALNFPVSGFSSKDVELFDINSDGWLDVVIVNYGQSTRVYFNTGGKFANDQGQHFPQEDGDGDNSNNLRSWPVDVDADGDLDLLVQKDIGGTNSWLWVYLNDFAQGGTGVFTDATPANLPVWRGEDSRRFAIGDLNGDSLPDLLIVNEDHQNWLLLNHGWAENKPMVDASRVPIGAFANNTFFGVPEEVGDAYVAAAGDIDNDGDNDIIIGYVDPDRPIGVWINDSEGNFFDESATRMPLTNCNARGLVLIDINDDHDPDVLLACQKGKRQLVNDGTGFFTDVSATNMPDSNGGDYLGLVLGDIDGDGDEDLLLGSSGYTAWGTLINGGDAFNNDGAFFVVQNQLLNTSWTTTCGNCLSEKAIVLKDLNADGDLDVYIGMASGQNQLWHNSDGLGLMTHMTPTHLPAVGDTTNRVLATDVDFDGDVDLYVVNNGVNRLHIGELDYKYADATGSNVPQYSENSTWGAVVDLDLDGFPDVITTTWEAQNRLILNKGGAIFEDFTDSLPRDIDPSRCIVASDLNGDGVVDLFIANRQANRIYINKTPPPQ